MYFFLVPICKRVSACWVAFVRVFSLIKLYISSHYILIVLEVVAPTTDTENKHNFYSFQHNIIQHISTFLCSTFYSFQNFIQSHAFLDPRLHACLYV